jgi:excisionase family DNA binding protein
MSAEDEAAFGEVLTIDEAAQFLRCGVKVVRRLARLRQIPHRKLDRRGTLRFSRVALEQWLQNGRAA